MPPAVLIGEVGPSLTGEDPTETQAAVASQVVHHGIGLGVTHALVARRLPGVSRALNPARPGTDGAVARTPAPLPPGRTCTWRVAGSAG